MNDKEIKERWKKAYSEMTGKYIGDGILDFWLNEIHSARNMPIGVSQWKKYGKEHDYWDYFEKEVREKEERKYNEQLLELDNQQYEGATKSLFPQSHKHSQTTPLCFLFPESFITVRRLNFCPAKFALFQVLFLSLKPKP